MCVASDDLQGNQAKVDTTGDDYHLSRVNEKGVAHSRGASQRPIRRRYRASTALYDSTQTKKHLTHPFAKHFKEMPRRDTSHLLNGFVECVSCVDRVLDWIVGVVRGGPEPLHS